MNSTLGSVVPLAMFDDYLRYLLVIMSSDLSDKTNGKEEVHSGTWL